MPKVYIFITALPK